PDPRRANLGRPPCSGAGVVRHRCRIGRHAGGAPQTTISGHRSRRRRTRTGRIKAMNKAANSQSYCGHAPTESVGGVPVLSLLLNDQRQRWRRGEKIFVEAYLESTASLQEDQEKLLDLICNEVVLRGERGEVPQLGEYLKRFEPFQQKFPNLATQLRLLFEVEGMI